MAGAEIPPFLEIYRWPSGWSAWMTKLEPSSLDRPRACIGLLDPEHSREIRTGGQARTHAAEFSATRISFAGYTHGRSVYASGCRESGESYWRITDPETPFAVMIVGLLLDLKIQTPYSGKIVRDWGLQLPKWIDDESFTTISVNSIPAHVRPKSDRVAWEADPGNVLWGEWVNPSPADAEIADIFGDPPIPLGFPEEIEWLKGRLED